MIKEHVNSGKLYLCVKYTDSENIAINYTGSGLIVKRLCEKYGRKCMKHHSILFKTDNKKELSKLGELYSVLYDVVKNKDWLNLVPELGGGGCKCNPNRSRIIISNEILSKTKFIFKEDLEKYIKNGWLKGPLKKTLKKISRANKGRVAHNRGKRMKQPHEYKSDRHIVKTDEEKFKNRSAARSEINSRPDVYEKLCAPRKSLLKMMNLKTKEIKTMGRKQWIDEIGYGIKKIINGKHKTNITKGWKFIEFVN